MEINAVLILIIFLLLACMAFSHFRNLFKFGYYEQKLINRGLSDAVKEMAWYKLWIN